MRVNDNYKEVNAASQIHDAQSTYSAYRELLRQRKAYKEIFIYGDFAIVDEDNDRILAYKRIASNGDTALVVCNFSSENVAWQFAGKPSEIIFSPAGKTMADVNGHVELGPYEAIALLL